MSPFQTRALGWEPAGMPGPADQQRHLGRLVVGDELALVQAVLALHEALVRGEDQIGVAERPVGLQVVDDPLDGVIHR